jgi:hypothetical protein
MRLLLRLRASSITVGLRLVFPEMPGVCVFHNLPQKAALAIPRCRDQEQAKAEELGRKVGIILHGKQESKARTPEPGPAFVGWSLIVGSLVVVAVMVFRVLIG